MNNPWLLAGVCDARAPLPIRVCSPRKTNVKRGEPGTLYSSPMITAFVRKIVGATCNRDYAILSRKHGIMFGWEEYDQYRDDEELDDDALYELLVRQWKQDRSLFLVYWNHRPLTHDKWVKLLRRAGFSVIEARTLDEIKQLSDGVIPRHMKPKLPDLPLSPPWRDDCEQRVEIATGRKTAPYCKHRRGVWCYFDKHMVNSCDVVSLYYNHPCRHQGPHKDPPRFKEPVMMAKTKTLFSYFEPGGMS